MKPTIYNVFGKEMSLIRYEAVFNFVARAFEDHCPDYFWTIPASVRGHHPPICRTRGGLVHHVKLAVAFADGFNDMLCIQDEAICSQIISAVLLHDMLKRGATEDENDTWPGSHKVANRDHGRYCATQLTKFLQKNVWGIDALPKLVPIINAVRLHMGRWTWELRPDEHEELFCDTVVRTCHLADYAASRALHQYLAERVTDPTMEYLRN